MEEYTINFGNGWTIENQKNLNENITVDKIDWVHPFGEFEVYKDEINWIYESFPITDEQINTCKDNELFNKKASFKVYKLDKEWIFKEEFKGTFIEALEYIKKEFSDE